MKRTFGWILLAIGSFYPALLCVQGIEWLISKQSISVYIPLLIISLIIAFVGFYLREGIHVKKV